MGTGSLVQSRFEPEARWGRERIIRKSGRIIEIKRDRVVKSFDDPYLASKEHCIYNHLSKLLPETALTGGWRVTAPEVLSADKHSVTLELLRGPDLSSAIKHCIEVPWKQLGEGLAVFHNNAFDYCGGERIYSEFFFSHILIDFQENRIGFIDPGGDFLEHRAVSRDVLKVLQSLFMRKLKHMHVNKKAATDFYNGWSDFLKKEIKLKNANELMNNVGKTGNYFIGYRRFSKIDAAMSIMLFSAWKYLYLRTQVASIKFQNLRSATPDAAPADNPSLPHIRAQPRPTEKKDSLRFHVR